MKKESKVFKIEVILSCIYGILLCKIGEVYECLNWCFNDATLFTHQLPNAGRIACPLIEKQHPFLKNIFLSDINTENWKEKLEKIKSCNPHDIELYRIGEYPSGLFSDLQNIIDKDKIIVVVK